MGPMTQARARKAYRLGMIAVMVAAVPAGTALAQSSQPTNIGAWKLNVAKSTYTPGSMPRSSTIRYEVVGARVRVSVDTVTADGTVAHSVYTTAYDGKECPITGTNTSADVTVVTRVDAYTTRRINKSGGKTTITQTAVVSKDGRTLTVTSKGKSATGLVVDSTAVYDRR